MWDMACVTRVTRVELCGACVEIVLRGSHLINWLRSESVEEIECLHQLFLNRSFYSWWSIATCVALEVGREIYPVSDQN